MKTFARILYVTLINLLILVLMLVIIDPFLALPEHKGLTRNILLKELSPSADYTTTPTDLYMTGTEGLVQKPYPVRTDKDGFLIGERNYLIDSNNVDIIFFGGSTTACLFVEEAKRYPLLVQGKLVNKHNSINLNILNAGMSGNNTLHSLVNFIAKGIPKRPKVVVLMEDINDLSLLSKTGSYWVAPSTKEIIQEGKDNSIEFKNRVGDFFKSTKNLLFPNIYNRLYYWVKGVSARKDIKTKTVPVDEDEFASFRNFPVPGFEKIQQEFKRMLYSFIYVAKAQGIKVVLMTQFNRLVPGDRFVRDEYSRRINNISFESFCDQYSIFNQIIRDIAASEKLPLIDLDKTIPKSRTYMFDAVHLNNNGSEFVAEVISKKLTEFFPDFVSQPKK